MDESPIFSLKIEQNHSSPITKFITDLTNTLFNAVKFFGKFGKFQRRDMKTGSPRGRKPTR